MDTSELEVWACFHTVTCRIKIVSCGVANGIILWIFVDGKKRTQLKWFGATYTLPAP
jgi:hypothetical protein